MAALNSPLHPKALRYLAAVAQLGSVQAAAREVSISASAIDRQILMLEEDMGVPLFERLPRGMRLTAAGELLLALSQRWKTDLNRTLSDVKQLQGVSQGQLRLAAMDSHVNGFLPGFIHRVAQGASWHRSGGGHRQHRRGRALPDRGSRGPGHRLQPQAPA